MIPQSEQYVKLRRLWDQHRTAPFPGSEAREPRLQEVALYESWLGGLVEASLARGGRLAAAHLRMLEVREREGNQPMWSLASELGEPVRSYIARLIAIQDVLRELPVE